LLLQRFVSHMRTPRGLITTVKLGLATVITLVLIEGLLRVYNPLVLTVKGDTISLPANVHFDIRNPGLPGIDAVVSYSRNSIGFRGPEPPLDLGRYLSLITVGGSTTECLFLSDGETWPALLEKDLQHSFRDVWVNNGGFDGHSTFGHLVLIKDYVTELKPKVVLLMAGINDMNFTGGTPMDKSLAERHGGETYLLNVLRGWSTDGTGPSLLSRAAQYSELAALVQNLARYREAKRLDLPHRALDLHSMARYTGPPHVIEQQLAGIRNNRGPFAERLKQIYDLTNAAGIDLVLVTQSALWGAGVDDVTGVEVGDIAIALGNARSFWQGLEIFNDALRELGRQHDLLVIDLATEMPKSSRYYYDGLHFNPVGAARVAAIMTARLCPHLRERFPEYFVGDGCHPATPARS
jgi:lysophospholipase L1-like esterase